MVKKVLRIDVERVCKTCHSHVVKYKLHALSLMAWHIRVKIVAFSSKGNAAQFKIQDNTVQ